MAYIDMTEENWWNKFGPIVDQIWHYDDFLNKIIRQEYMAEMKNFLYEANGSLMDFGCGAGWLSLSFAQHGMSVDGIDSSLIQIRRARQKAHDLGLTNVRFWCANSLSVAQCDTYNAVLLHAILHHIPPDKRWSFLKSIDDVMLKEGKLYVYEPLAAMHDPPWQAKATDTIMGLLLQVLKKVARTENLYRTEIVKALNNGWTMQSPKEQPIRLNQLIDLLSSQFSILKISPWHCWSVVYANFCMSLQPSWQRRMERFAPLFYTLDCWVRDTNWYPYLHSWPMVSILAQK